MQPEFVERDEAWILGVPIRLNPQTADWRAIWHEQVFARSGDITPHSRDGCWYSAMWSTDEPGMLDFVGGMNVGADTPVAEGLALRRLAGGREAVFRCTLEELPAAWPQVLGQWLPTAPSPCDPARPMYEQYTADGAGAEIRIPLLAG